jgi:methyl-accepting chemotaxis protein
VKRPSIASTLVGSFSVLAIILLAIGIMGIVELGKTNTHVRELATDWLPSVEGVKEMDTALSDLRAAYRDHILAVDDESEKRANAEIASELQRFAKATDNYETLVVEPEEKELLNKIRAAMKLYSDAGSDMVQLSADQKDEEAKSALSGMRQHANEIAAIIDTIVTSNVDGSRQAYLESDQSYATSIWVMAGAIAASLVLAGGFIAFAINGIAGPIRRITASMQALAAGDKVSEIPYAGRTDEIGGMAAAVQVFRTNALANERLEHEAGLQRTASENERRATTEKDQERTGEMARATAGLAAGLKRLSEGDLTFRIVEEFHADYQSLRADFNAAVEQLSQTIENVSEATSAIDSGSREISQSAQDLSKRTEQQAASLEETAAALDQITANVSSASQRTDEARTVAVAANSAAHQSAQVVADAVNAMQRIESSSSQISSIIGVIDEIAFQTNLLALNAGVEAARAGEAGKGFAVVAQEVRELAQRSAKAAKEIKELIRNSEGEVGTGVKLVRATGEALKGIEAHVATINTQLEAIAISSKEQATGLAEVNTAVNQMDQVTQQNAAMVEESTAASATLATEAARMQELVGYFRVGGHTAASDRKFGQRDARPLRPTPMPASARQATVPSPARKMMQVVSKAMGASQAAKSDWEEF